MHFLLWNFLVNKVCQNEWLLLQTTTYDKDMILTSRTSYPTLPWPYSMTCFMGGTLFTLIFYDVGHMLSRTRPSPSIFFS